MTKQEIQAGIGLKSLILATDQNDKVVRVTSPVTLVPWEWDGTHWTCKAAKMPAAENKSGIYVTYSAREARGYIGTLCKVILSGTVVEHENGARGEFARVLEILWPQKRTGTLVNSWNKLEA